MATTEEAVLVRHGTVDLFAALNTATGKVIGKLSAQHRAVDFRDFLDEIDRQTDPGLAVHVICDVVPSEAPRMRTGASSGPSKRYWRAGVVVSLTAPR
ncbi:hypothetical protein [Streptomyces sp. AK010]|uniref:hypothetical protein n=1 Tax=Streptomyces sp. AK010 TaxID=2723074 RepID=UPI0017B31D82|nr:hypothetical protein [Streptomyces sp. AK010]